MAEADPEIKGKMLTEDEISNVVKALSQMEVRPNLDSPEAFSGWLADLQKGGARPREPQVVANVVHPPDPPPAPRQSISHLPKLSIFSGDPTPPKGEVLFDQWKYQVERLQAGRMYTEEVILQAVIQSLRGEAGRIVMRLGIHASLQQVLKELHDNYGVVRYPTDLLEDFYHAKQKEGESVTAFACRIEDLLSKARQREEMDEDRASLLLRRKLWRGLHTSLRNISSHKFDTIENYGQLKEAIRQIEDLDGDNTKVDSKPKPAKAAAAVSSSEMKEVKAMVNQLKGEIKEMRKEMSCRGSTPGNTVSGYSNTPSSYQNSSQSYYQPRSYNRYNMSGNQAERNANQRSANVYRQAPQCWRCGYYGHLQRDCNVRMDHSRRNLNARMPTGRGQQ